MTVTATVTLKDDNGKIIAQESSSFEVADVPASLVSKVITRLTPGRH
jgi:hypothetical protein